MGWSAIRFRVRSRVWMTVELDCVGVKVFLCWVQDWV